MDKKLYIPKSAINDRVLRISHEINADYPDGIVIIGVLKGSFMFLSDLMKNIKVDTSLDFIQAKSYEGTESSGTVKITKDIDINIKGKDVIVVEDIVDTGITMDVILNKIKDKKPNSVEICTLLYKPERTIIEHALKYVGFMIENKFVIGYGLDYNQKFRNYDEIYEVI